MKAVTLLFLFLLHKSRQAAPVRAHRISRAHPIAKLNEQTPKTLSNCIICITLKKHMELILNLLSNAKSAQPLLPRQYPAIHTLPSARRHSKVMSAQPKTNKRRQIRLVETSSIMHIIRATALGLGHVHLSKGRASKPAVISGDLHLHSLYQV
jgi:hypothetical protein